MLDKRKPSSAREPVIAAAGEIVAREGFLEPQLARELPGLRLVWAAIAARAQRSPPELAVRLRALASHYGGASVIALRTQPIPQAYRAFFRQIGLDPDTNRIPLEQAALRRLLDGGFTSRGLIEDALLLALIETGVPVWALDAARVSPTGLGIRLSRRGERLGEGELARPLGPGRLLVADSQRMHALLFGEIAPGHEVSRRTQAVVLFSVGVAGVPAIHTEEAIWQALELLAEHGAGAP
jgi:DNA/RNA-binding domain of Phe-tRNA-synthetase-like protein